MTEKTPDGIPEPEPERRAGPGGAPERAAESEPSPARTTPGDSPTPSGGSLRTGTPTRSYAPSQYPLRPQFQKPEPPPWVAAVRPVPLGRITSATLVSALATGVVAALLLGEGLGVNLLLVAVPAALAAFFAGRAAGRRPRPWTLIWGAGGLALLAVPVLRDEGWATFCAVVTALALGALALHGSRSWAGVAFGPLSLFAALDGVSWAWRGLRERAEGSRGRWGPAVRTAAVAAGLLLVFGGLFASADAAFAELLGSLVPETSVGDGPWRILLFTVGIAGALAAARTAAAPRRWDRIEPRPGRARGTTEWALPLIVLSALFAAFNLVQLTVLFGGYERVLAETGLSHAEYARQGFWQLLVATLLTLAVIAIALHWAPPKPALVRAVLGTLCVLTLAVVAAALRRMDLYVDAFGLTRLRVSVTAMELWLGLVIVMIMAAGVWGGRWLPRAVAAGAAAGVLLLGLLSPDGMIAERAVQRYEADTARIDMEYLRGLSADAVPALDQLPEPARSCALLGIDLPDKPWYATSVGEARARDVIAARPPEPAACDGFDIGDRYDYDEPY